MGMERVGCVRVGSPPGWRWRAGKPGRVPWWRWRWRLRGSGWRVGGVDEIGRGLAAAFALFGREPEFGAALVLGVAGVEGVVDADVAGDEAVA